MGQSQEISITLPKEMKRITEDFSNNSDSNVSLEENRVQIIFESDNTKVATVNTKGEVTGKMKETAKITIHIAENGFEDGFGVKKTFTTIVTVK